MYTWVSTESVDTEFRIQKYRERNSVEFREFL